MYMLNHAGIKTIKEGENVRSSVQAVEFSDKRTTDLSALNMLDN
jgi:hypothetical protein